MPGEEHGSEIVNESTANGAAGFFYRQCKTATAGAGAYKLHFFPWFEATEYAIPLQAGEEIKPANDRERALVAKGVTPEQIKWYRAKRADKSQNDIDQEYPSDPETCFLVSGRGFFDQIVTSELLAIATDPIELRERDRIGIWKKAEAGKKYVISVDTAEGGGGDPSAAIVRERETGEHCATLNGQYASHDLAASSAKLGTEYNQAEIAVERNNHGHAVLQALAREQKYPKIYRHTDDKPGWLTSAVTRPVMLDALEDAHRKGLWKTRDRNVLTQMRTFIVPPSGKPEAAHGEHDDLVLAEAIGWAVRQKPIRTYANY